MEDQIQRKNFDEICRLCLEYASETTALYPLFINKGSFRGYYGRFFTEFKESIPEIISACIGIELDPTDSLPMGICSACEEQLIASNKFRHKCLLSNNYLLDLKLKPEDDDEQYDTEDDAPLNSLKPPELILVDSVKEESNDRLDDSEIDSAWNTFQSEDETCTTLTKIQSDKRLVKASNDENSTKKSAVKTSITIPLVTPTTPIVPMTSNDPSDVNKKLFCEYSQKQLERRCPVKKPKMCTVCGWNDGETITRPYENSYDALDFSCSQCSRKYLTKQGLVKHINITHTEDSNQPTATTEQKRSLQMQKLKKYRGKVYISKNGVVRNGKCIRKPCNDQCAYKCIVHVSDDQRKEIFDNFYKLGSIQLQWQFIARCMDPILPKRRRIVENSKRMRNERSLNVGYYFRINGKKVRVCRTFFLNTLNISNSMTKTALEKCDKNGELIEGDRRGSKTKLNKIVSFQK